MSRSEGAEDEIRGTPRSSATRPSSARSSSKTAGRTRLSNVARPAASPSGGCRRCGPPCRTARVLISRGDDRLAAKDGLRPARVA